MSMYVLPLLEKDLDRYHLSPMEPARRKVMVCTTARGTKKNKKLSGFPIYTTAQCPVHPFRNVEECMYSQKLGPGYPANRSDRVVVPYWKRMAKINYRWMLRSSREDLEEYRGTQPDYIWETRTGVPVGIWFCDECSSCKAQPRRMCGCPGRKVLIQKQKA